MKMKFTLLLLVSFCLPWVAPAHAQWYSDSAHNTVVCNATNIQWYPSACSDESNGVIVAWADLRSGSSYDIYTQRLNANGTPLWGTNGILVCNNASAQQYPLIASDGQGGAYVVWQDYRTVANGVDLYGQHITSSGSLSYGQSGAAVATGPRDQDLMDITSDERGNAIVVWEDYRNSVVSSRPDVYANKLTSSSVAWGSGGIAISTLPAHQSHPRVCADGSGGAYIAFENSATVPMSIYAQRISSSGSPLWTQNGILIYKGANTTPNAENCKSPSIRRDGNQLLITWEITNASPSSGQDILANRINSDSTKVWFSPAEVTGDWNGDQTNPQIFSDDSAGTSPSTNKGILVLFNDYQDDIAPFHYQENLVAVRVYPDGVSRLPSYSNGFFSVCKQAYGQVGFRAIPIDPGKVLAVWNDSRYGATDTSIYAQYFDRNATRYFPTAGTMSQWGLPISVSTSYLSHQVALAPRDNGAIAVWTDNRNGNNDIYAQLIFKNGTLPIELATFRVVALSQNTVALNWTTTREANNAGYEIQRRLIADGQSNDYNVVASYTTDSRLLGAGTTTTSHQYSYQDQNLTPGTYEYRIIDIALDGTRTAHEPKTIDTHTAAITSWGSGPVWPNPAASRLEVPISVPIPVTIDVSIYDVTGRLVAHPVSNATFTAGDHSVPIDLSTIQLPAGSYRIRVAATDPTTGKLLWQSPQPQLLNILH